MHKKQHNFGACLFFGACQARLCPLVHSQARAAQLDRLACHRCVWPNVWKVIKRKRGGRASEARLAGCAHGSSGHRKRAPVACPTHQQEMENVISPRDQKKKEELFVAVVCDKRAGVRVPQLFFFACFSKFTDGTNQVIPRSSFTIYWSTLPSGL